MECNYLFKNNNLIYKILKIIKIIFIYKKNISDHQNIIKFILYV